MRSATGGFDERFELYYEDVDLCSRAEALGPIRFALTSWGTHTGGASSSGNTAAAYLVGSLVVGLAAVGLGVTLGESLFGRRRS